MAKLDLRVKLLGRILAATGSVDRMDERRIARAQQQRLRHNVVTDLMFGAIAPGVSLTDGTAEGQAGRIAVRSYRPTRATGPLPLVVNFHGGGFVLGSLDQSDHLCSTVAARVGAVVVSVDYRLAPKHPWPAGPEDSYAALADIVARAAEFGADRERVAVMGDSAGATLSAVVALMARDRSGPALTFRALLYPATDMTMASPSIEENATAPVLTKAECVTFRDLYLAGQDPRDPYVSPLFAADHTGLPAALVQVAEHDPIRDDGLRYADTLRAAGVPVRATTYVGMPHGYLTFPTLCRSTPQAMAELCGELRSALTA
ncbi:MAG TPA: alpha/beta hydrolase [Pseudonocardiaceae bacterium]|nr:alpha/beta hydrolase [Pseudonocardiaceae bacterium]